MAIKATFSAAAGILSEIGDSVDNTIVTSRDAAGQLFVNGGAVPIVGGQATVANTALVQVFGQAAMTRSRSTKQTARFPPPNCSAEPATIR